MSDRIRKWLVLTMLFLAGWLWNGNYVQGAMAQISIQKSSDVIVKGDIFYIVVTVASDEEMTGFEGYFSYDQDIMKYITGGSVASGNDNEIHIKDLDREQGTKKIKYSLQFRARKKGESNVGLKRGYHISTDDEDTKFSVGTASVNVQVISKKEYEKTMPQQTGETENAQDISEIPEEASPEAASAVPEKTDIFAASAVPQTTCPTEDVQKPENIISETKEPEVSDTVPEQPEKKGLTRGTCLVIICLALIGLGMVLILLAGVLRSKEEYMEIEDFSESEEDQDTGEIDNGKKVADQEIQIQDLQEIEKRLEEKRRWLRKE